MPRLRTALLLLVAFALPAAAQDYAIERVEGDVYRFTAGSYRSVYAVTSEGIVVTDPISEEAATWLKAELERRYDVPIRYVLYSHNHPDHAYGGEVFAGPGVEFVAHEYAREDLVRTRAQTQIPTLTFQDEMTLRVGEKTIRLRYHGPNNGRGSVSMAFAPSGVMHVVDWIVLGRLPYRDLKGYDIHGMIRSTRAVLDLPGWSVLVGGHAEMGNRDDVRHYLGYLEALYEHVLTGIRAGKSLATIQDEATFPDYADLAMYDEWLALNVKGVYETLIDQSYMLMRPDVPEPGDGG